MIHGFALGLGLAIAFVLVGSIMRRGLGRTIIDFLKLAFWTVTALAAATVIAVVVFRLTWTPVGGNQQAHKN
jgi:hypothetical protein